MNGDEMRWDGMNGDGIGLVLVFWREKVGGGYVGD